MCFFIDDKYPNELIAKNDIVCYKKFQIDYNDNRRIVGAYQFGFTWWDTRRKTDTVHKKTQFDKNHSTMLYSGFHSYSNKRECMDYTCPDLKEFCCKCIIPKGAKYYYNSYKMQYISTEIIVYTNVIIKQ